MATRSTVTAAAITEAVCWSLCIHECVMPWSLPESQEARTGVVVRHTKYTWNKWQTCGQIGGCEERGHNSGNAEGEGDARAQRVHPLLQWGQAGQVPGQQQVLPGKHDQHDRCARVLGCRCCAGRPGLHATELSNSYTLLGITAHELAGEKPILARLHGKVVLRRQDSWARREQFHDAHHTNAQSHHQKNV